jgi:hypothetical protein
MTVRTAAGPVFGSRMAIWLSKTDAGAIHKSRKTQLQMRRSNLNLAAGTIRQKKRLVNPSAGLRRGIAPESN